MLAAPGLVRSMLLMLYDADCAICIRFKNLIKLLDTGDRIRPITMHSPRARQLLAELSDDDYWRGFHILDAEGKAYHAATAIPELLRVCRPGRLLARILTAHGFIVALTSFVYAAFLREHATGACQLPLTVPAR